MYDHAGALARLLATGEKPDETADDSNEIYDLPAPRVGEDGQPIYDQGFFLELWRRGKDVWNHWQRTNPGIQTTFEGVDFGTANFQYFEFAHDRAVTPNVTIYWVNFRRCRFRGTAAFERAVFFGNANFSGTTFHGRAKFSGVSFRSGVDFSKVKFRNYADLSCAAVRGRADFTRAAFDYVDLSGTVFMREAGFNDAIFRGDVKLSTATFEEYTSFARARFRDSVDLTGTTFQGMADFSESKFHKNVDLSALSESKWRRAILMKTSWLSYMWEGQEQEFMEQRDKFIAFHEAIHSRGLGPDSLGLIDFRNSYFRGVARFTGRTFTSTCILAGSRFSRPPVFDECTNTGRINLYGVNINLPGWTRNSGAALNLRSLRKLAEETKNHDLERDLYIEERKVERGVVLTQYWRQGASEWKVLVHCLWIAIMFLYWLLADYGRSLVRPLVALVLSVFAFYWTYVAAFESVAVLESPNAAATRDFKDAAWAYATANAVPFVGALTVEKEVKTTLLCGGRADYRAIARSEGVASCVHISSRRFQLLTIGQSIFSAVCVFFAGLALRNYFKLK